MICNDELWIPVKTKTFMIRLTYAFLLSRKFKSAQALMLISHHSYSDSKSYRKRIDLVVSY